MNGSQTLLETLRSAASALATDDYDGASSSLERAIELAEDERADSLEIERKYLLSALPELVGEHPSVEICQGYIPGEAFRERLRRIDSNEGSRFRRTLKAGRGLSRIEIEEDVDEALFEKLFACTEGARVHKRRYRVPMGELVWEIDEFLDRELVLAEVELPSVDTEAPMPDWLRAVCVREVTEESAYVNQVLAK